ncbi:hypothetical protein E1286_40665 [Nonomuraea terrae]|uniref:Uncharacterized protein n=1 Tax=Nonomuraea terrae TaxID=2530383 RepID=A0A4R4XTC8_9ACTN|nr:hypothetical protein [Nonomuraea terrae]TDD34616.1 hypothetical protein E1286_40665 [Nonomuraea terrae]
MCVESNELYVEVGRRVLPEATWIVGDVFDVSSMGLGMFDCAISKPPSGCTPRGRVGPRYRGQHRPALGVAFAVPGSRGEARGGGGGRRESHAMELVHLVPSEAWPPCAWDAAAGSSL